MDDRPLEAGDDAATSWVRQLAHDLRSPLAVATGFAAMLEHGSALADDPAARLAVRRVQEVGEEILALVDRAARDSLSSARRGSR